MKKINLIIPAVAVALSSLVSFSTLDYKISDIYQRVLPSTPENEKVAMLNINDDSEYQTLISGSDMIIVVEDASITLSGAASLETIHIDGAFQTRLIVDNSSDKKITLGSSIELVDASTRTKAIKITGNELSNSILGGSGNDVIKNSNSTDIINLLGVSLEQITSVDVTVSEVNVNFVDGGNLKVEGNTSVGYKLGNTVYAVNQSTGEWFTK